MARPTVVLLATLLGSSSEYVLAVPDAEYGWEVPSRDAKVAVLIDRKGQGRVWDVTGRAARLTSAFRFGPPPSDLQTNADSFPTLPDRAGDRVAILSDGGSRLTVARVRPFAPLWSRPVKPAYGLNLDWSPDGGTLLVQEEDGTRLFAADGRDLGRLPIRRPLAFQGGVVYGLAKGGVAGYALATRRPGRRIADPEATEPLGVSPDGRWLVAGSHLKGRYVYRVWRLADGRAVGEAPGSSQNLNEGFDPEFPAPGRFRLNGVKEDRALPSGRLVAKLPGWAPIGYTESSANPSRFPRADFPPSTDAPYRAWPQAGGALLVASPRQATFLDPLARRARAIPTELGGATQAVARDDGSLALIGGKGVLVFPPGEGRPRFVAAPRVGDEPVRSRLLPGGREAEGRPFMGGAGVRWRVDDGKVLAALPEERPGLPASPGPDGALYRQLPSTPQGTLERVGAWKINATGRFTSRAVPTPDGKAVVVAEQLADYGKPSDARLRVLDAATGKEIRSFPTPEARGLALSPDGRGAALWEPDGIELLALDGSSRRKVPDSATASSNLVWWGADRVATLGNYPQAIDVRAARVAARWASWRDGGWVVWTPEGAADGNATGLARLFRAEGTGVVPLGVPVRRDEAWRALGG